MSWRLSVSLNTFDSSLSTDADASVSDHRWWQTRLSMYEMNAWKLTCAVQKTLDSQDLSLRLKGTVHPKMKILSSFTHPQVVPNLYECLFCWTQRKIFWRMWETLQFWIIVFFFFYYGSQWCPKTAWLQTFFKISSFVFRTKKFIQVWNYLRVSKWWQNFHFWVYCPFKS